VTTTARPRTPPGAPIAATRRPPRGVRRVGLLGGTFNPVHLAHLRCAEEVREQQRLERVLFIPSAVPPHKAGAEVIAAEHRLAMVRLAVAGNPAFRVSTIEIRRAGHSYSVDTLRLLHARMPGCRFLFILGMDAFRDLATWKEYTAIFGLCDILVISRPPHEQAPGLDALPIAVRSEFCYGSSKLEMRHTTGHCIRFQRISALDISASTIRQRLRAGRSIRYLVPLSVERYIARHGLYAPKGPAR